MESDSVEAVEKILNYSFVNKTLLKEALTKRSSNCVESSIPLFERLEFLGDSVLELAFTNYIHLTYPKLKLKELRELRTANVSNERFARVAVNHNLHQFAIRENPDPSVTKRIKEFSEAVSKEDELVPYGGLVKAPKFLADLVESIAGAVYVDVNFNIQRLWEIIGFLFEPIYTLDDLRQPQPPFLTLFRLADKHGKQIDFRCSKDDTNKYISEVYLDDIFIASGCAKRMDTAKLLAANEALQKVSECMPTEKVVDEIGKLFDICSTEKPQSQSGSSSSPTASEKPLNYEMTQEQMVTDDDSLHVEPEDVKQKLFENCSTEKFQLQSGSSSLSSASEKPLNYEITPTEMVIDEGSPHVEPEDVKGKLFEICSTRNLQIQTESSSSSLTASENPSAYEMTQEQMVTDEDNPHLEPADVKGKLFEICSTRKLQTQTESSSLPSANPLVYEITVKQMVVDENSLEAGRVHAKSNLITICTKNKWPAPIFSVEEETERKDEQKYACSVKIEIPAVEGIFHMKGDAKSKKRLAENSSAYHMIRFLKSSLMSFVLSDLKMPKSLDGKKNLQMQKSSDENKNLHSKGTVPPLDAVALSSEMDYDSVEKILNYSFVNKNLLKEALTFTPSGSPSFDQYMFVGEAALTQAFMNHIYLMYPKLEPKNLCKLKDANTNNHHLACIAVRHGLLCNDDKVIKFLDPVPPNNGIGKAPKILTNLVESIAGAVYIDVNFDVQRLWEIIRFLFEPIYTLDDLKLQHQPLRTLSCLGDKHGKRIEFRYEESGNKGSVFAQVYIDDEYIARGKVKKTRDSAKESAATVALQKLSESMAIDIVMEKDSPEIEIEDAKDKLLEICNKRKWPNPVYSVEKQGRKAFVCSAKIETPSEESTLCVKGGKRKQRKVAENSSAANMIKALKSALKDDL